MHFVRISRLLLVLTLIAWISTRTASKSTVVRPRARRGVAVNELTTTAKIPDVPTNSSGVYCPSVNGLSWTLFRENCYYVIKSV